MQYIIIIFLSFFALRLISLSFSIRNEKRLLKKGGKQYGKFNSLLLTLAHIAFYFVMLFAYVMLFYVMYKLRDVWTVKLYIVPNQRIERSLLFRTVRHPNYFLNIMPELIGVALLCNAWYTLCIGFPLYVVLLIVRIRQEEAAMKELFAAAEVRK